MPVPARLHATLALILGAAGVAVAILAVPRGRIPSAAEPPLEATPSPAEQQHAGTHGRYATARLHLAQANLEKAENLALAIPGEVTDRELMSLRRRVELLRQHVGTTVRLPHGNSTVLAREAAAAAVRQASDDLLRARAASRRQEAAVSPFEIARLQAAVELAQARQELWDDPSFLDSPLQMMQMQIDQLSDDVFELAHRVDNAPYVDRR